MVGDAKDMTEQEQQVALWLEQCKMLPGSREKRFRNDMAYCARHNPEKALTYAQQKYLGGLFWRYREQIARHRGERWPVTVSHIAKGPVEGQLRYYGLEHRCVVPLEVVEFYVYLAAQVPEVSLSVLAGMVDEPGQEAQRILKCAA
jgi:hypothetical protein